MVDKEKVVVTLLLITIILSLVSVIVTVSIGDDKSDSGNESDLGNPDSTASVGLTVEPPAGTGGTG